MPATGEELEALLKRLLQLLESAQKPSKNAKKDDPRDREVLHHSSKLEDARKILMEKCEKLQPPTERKCNAHIGHKLLVTRMYFEGLIKALGDKEELVNSAKRLSEDVQSLGKQFQALPKPETEVQKAPSPQTSGRTAQKVPAKSNSERTSESTPARHHPSQDAKEGTRHGQAAHDSRNPGIHPSSVPQGVYPPQNPPADPEFWSYSQSQAQHAQYQRPGPGYGTSPAYSPVPRPSYSTTYQQSRPAYVPSPSHDPKFGPTHSIPDQQPRPVPTPRSEARYSARYQNQSPANGPSPSCNPNPGSSYSTRNQQQDWYPKTATTSKSNPGSRSAHVCNETCQEHDAAAREFTTGSYGAWSYDEARRSYYHQPPQSMPQRTTTFDEPWGSQAKRDSNVRYARPGEVVEVPSDEDTDSRALVLHRDRRDPKSNGKRPTKGRSGRSAAL